MFISNSFRTYQTLSGGLTVNLCKTEIVPLGPMKQHYSVLLEDDQLKWTTDPIKCLGIIIGTDKDRLVDLNYTPIITKMNKIIQFWNKQQMTMFGKVVTINHFLISQLVYLVSSQLVYLMSVLTTSPTQTMKQINARPERIKRKDLQNTKESGGVPMTRHYIKR